MNECAHCTTHSAGAEGTIWCERCLEWWRASVKADSEGVACPIPDPANEDER